MHRTKKDKKFKFVYAEIRLGSSETQMPGLMRPCPRPLLGEASPSKAFWGPESIFSQILFGRGC